MTPPSLHIKVDSSASDDASDEIVLHKLPDGMLFLELYQGPGLGTHRAQTTLDPAAIDSLVRFIGPRAGVDHGFYAEEEVKP